MNFSLGANNRECLKPLQFCGNPSHNNLHAIVSGRPITFPDIRTMDPGVNVSNIEMTKGTTGVSNDSTKINKNKTQNDILTAYCLNIFYFLSYLYNLHFLFSLNFVP